MQLYDRRQTAPVLARKGTTIAFFCMQNHAPYACKLKKRGPPEKIRETRGGEAIKTRTGKGAGGEASMHVVVASVAIQSPLLWWR
ncbi:hypothetical protein AWC35_11810 [Gibbsiella quercinecans]|uniref:Uncharacterized protein n=1 Tax=Gibbsiella quercinecans TaxID=929813 RepID=A0A250B131_9GAMM|nr:hypothetical protein AWC35_11810 [Gibbsiella quercinecans]RLM03556.1 hypothetical protein BIY31_21080 [Gibbsiella quercinecans]RLM04034.1 hypothetical protein BIY30_21010 [Gibbsiella quercinecans]